MDVFSKDNLILQPISEHLLGFVEYIEVIWETLAQEEVENWQSTIKFNPQTYVVGPEQCFGTFESVLN